MKSKIGLLSTVVVFSVVLGLTQTTQAATPGPYSLSFRNCQNGTVNPGFTSGPSVDSGKKAVTLDGGNCWLDDDSNPNSSSNPNGIASISFTDFWEFPLENVSQLKGSWLGPFTQGGSPRISVLLQDGFQAGLNGDVLYLDPKFCGIENSAGWVNSDFRHGVTNCTINYYNSDTAQNETYTGVPKHRVNGVDVPAVAAWDLMTQAHPFRFIYQAFAIADQPTVNRLDKIQLNAQVFTS